MKFTQKLAGRYKIKLTRPNGTVRYESDWFDNLITNQGMDAWAIGFPGSANAQLVMPDCAVGTGTTPPAFTDTQLEAIVLPAVSYSGASSGVWTTSSYIAGPPAYWSGIINYQWAQGAIVANISEVGVGNAVSGVIQLFSRALIVDNEGNPTTISVTATDTLTVTYEIRMYLDLTDSPYAVSISGTAISGTQRMANVTTVAFTPNIIDFSYSGGLSVTYNTYNGSIGTVTGHPSGTGFFSTTGAGTRVGTYTNGSYTLEWTVTVPAGSTLTMTISAMMFTTGFGSWQFSLSPAFSLLSTQEFSNTISVAWARFTP